MTPLPASPCSRGTRGPRYRPAHHHLGRPPARAGNPPARRARHHRRVLGRRPLHRPLAGAVCRPAGPPGDPDPDPAALLYLKHRYQLGYESLCAEVGDSISWRRFCRIPLDQPVPHPTTLVKLVGRAGPATITQLNTALLGRLAERKLLRGRKLRIDTTVVEADIDYPTDADLLARAVRTISRLVGRITARGAATRTPFRDRSRAAGRRLRLLSQTLRRRGGQAPEEVDR